MPVSFAFVSVWTDIPELARLGFHHRHILFANLHTKPSDAAYIHARPSSVLV